MSVGLYLRSFFGFALQLVPFATLLPIPFQEDAFTNGRKKAFAQLVTISLFFSLCYPINVSLSMRLTENSNLDDNLFMLLAVIGVTVLFIRITRESPVRKLTALFIVISYAAVQFFLSNMLMDFLPLAKQDMTYNDATLASYLIVTAVLLPPVILFMHFKMKNYLSTVESAAYSQTEFLFLVAVLVLYLILNVLYSALWVRLRDTLRLSFLYFIPFSLFLSSLLIFTFYSKISLSVSKARNREQAVELALMRQNYTYIEENIQQQKRALHDTRQLLRNISGIAKNEPKETLLKYIDEAMDHTVVSDTRFCLNPCINGLLAYYAGLAETQGIGFSVRAVCSELPFSDSDLTILLGNALDNAVRSAAEFGEANPGAHPEIHFLADTVKDQFAIQIENPCVSVSYAKPFLQGNRTEGVNWFPAEAFLSTHRGGYGLRRMELITGKYHGYAGFSYNPVEQVFTTRLMLPLSEV